MLACQELFYNFIKYFLIGLSKAKNSGGNFLGRGTSWGIGLSWGADRIIFLEKEVIGGWGSNIQNMGRMN
jgi:hypothetical protein